MNRGERIGEGNNWEVFKGSNDGLVEKVSKFEVKGQEQFNRRAANYYLQFILSKLTKGFIPDVRKLELGEGEKEQKLVRTEKLIQTDPEHKILSQKKDEYSKEAKRLTEANEWNEEKYDWSEKTRKQLYEEFREYNKRIFETDSYISATEKLNRLGVALDTADGALNFTFNADGTVSYVDEVNAYLDTYQNFNPDELKKSVEGLKNESDKRECLIALKRLEYYGDLIKNSQ